MEDVRVTGCVSYWGIKLRQSVTLSHVVVEDTTPGAFHTGHALQVEAVFEKRWLTRGPPGRTA